MPQPFQHFKSFAEFVTVLHAFVLQQRDVGDLDTYVNFGVEEIAPGRFIHHRQFNSRLQAHVAYAAEFYGTKWSKFQHQVWIALEQPSSSVLATCISVAIMTLIFASTLSFVLETDPNLRTAEHAAGFAAVEAVSVTAFTLEYILRLMFCPDKVKFLKSPMNAVDLFAVMPFFVERLMASSNLKGSQVLRVIRLVRVFRLMKISRYLTWLKVFGNTLMLSGAPLGMILFITSIATVVSSSVMYYVERDAELGRASHGTIPFDSIPATFWWCVITMSTVGYGDMVPQTSFGKLWAAMTAFSGILVSTLGTFELQQDTTLLCRSWPFPFRSLRPTFTTNTSSQPRPRSSVKNLAKATKSSTRSKKKTPSWCIGVNGI